MLNSKKIAGVIWDYFVLSVGTFLYCLAWESFLIPHNIASGGLTGACTILQFATGIPVAYSFIIANVFLLAMGVLVLGNAFGVRTIYAIALSAVLFKIIPKYDFLIAVEGQPLYIEQKLLLPIIGGLLEGLGISFIFKKGGSTGGTDVIALIINKFYPLSPGKVYLYTDLFIIATILLLPGRGLQDMVYGYITMITFSLSIDALTLGTKSSVQLLVFSKKDRDIADYIINQMNRGVTALKSVGWFTKEEKNVLLIIIRKTELSKLTHAIKDIDKDAFVSISPASSVYGEGFEQIKTGINKKSIKSSSITSKGEGNNKE